MRYIIQGNAPATFQNWKKMNPSKNWEDFSQPSSPSHAVYSEIRELLIDQQEKMCCYCEVALKQNTDAHVEHLKDKHSNPGETFNFKNLLASCQHCDCCGHKKGTNYFSEMVSPLDRNCQLRFTYTGNGKIIPLDEADTAAQKTINILGLNCKRLKDRRFNLIKIIDNEYTDFEQSLFNCLEWYQGFYTVIQYVASQQPLS